MMLDGVNIVAGFPCMVYSDLLGLTPVLIVLAVVVVTYLAAFLSKQEHWHTKKTRNRAVIYAVLSILAFIVYYFFTCQGKTILWR